jgi:hypothetical protein
MIVIIKATGMTLTLTAIDPSEVYGPAITPLEVLVEMDTNDRLHVKIYGWFVLFCLFIFLEIKFRIKNLTTSIIIIIIIINNQ